jgi:hypothetical protein
VRRALVLLGAAAAAIAGGGWLLSATWHLGYWHGLYCALGTAATDGCDTTGRTEAGWAAACAVILVAIPLLGAVFALLTGVHLRRHVDRALDERDQQRDEQDAERHRVLHDKLDRIEQGTRESEGR